MGYTHAATGAAVASSAALFIGNNSTSLFVVAVIAGTIGGVAIDIEVRDNKENPKVTDAGRTRIATLGLIVLGVLLDFALKLGIITKNITNPSQAVYGLVVFVLLMIAGSKTKHRTFTHSLLFTMLTGVCVYLVLPEASVFYVIGCLSHLLLDMLNKPFNNHGVWLLYPKKGKGIALGLCKSARTGNKVSYFIAIILFSVISVVYSLLDINIWRITPIIILLAYIVLAMHFVRIKSEREQRHIMHIRGEL